MQKMLIILSLVLLSSCTKTKVVDTLIGEANMSITETFNAGNNTELQIKVDTDSYCPGNGIEVEVLQNNSSIYTTTVQTIPFNHTFSIAQNANLEFKATSVDLNNGITCKRLGNAKLTVYLIE